MPAPAKGVIIDDGGLGPVIQRTTDAAADAYIAALEAAEAAKVAYAQAKVAYKQATATAQSVYEAESTQRALKLAAEAAARTAKLAAEESERVQFADEVKTAVARLPATALSAGESALKEGVAQLSKEPQIAELKKSVKSSLNDPTIVELQKTAKTALESDAAKAALAETGKLSQAALTVGGELVSTGGQLLGKSALELSGAAREGDGAVSRLLGRALRESSRQLGDAAAQVLPSLAEGTKSVAAQAAAQVAAQAEQLAALAEAEASSAATSATSAASKAIEAAGADARSQLAADPQGQAVLRSVDVGGRTAAELAARGATLAQRGFVAAQQTAAELEKSEVGKVVAAEGLERARPTLKTKVLERLELRRSQQGQIVELARAEAQKALMLATEQGNAAALGAIAEAQKAAAVESDALLASAPAEVRELIKSSDKEVQALLVRYAPEIRSALDASAQAGDKLTREILPRSAELGEQLVSSLSAYTSGEGTEPPTLSIGSVKLRAGMPLTELSPKLPALADELMKLASELASSPGGEELLRSLANTAVEGGAAASSIYANAEAAVLPTLKSSEAGMQAAKALETLRDGTGKVAKGASDALAQAQVLSVQASRELSAAQQLAESLKAQAEVLAQAAADKAGAVADEAAQLAPTPAVDEAAPPTGTVPPVEAEAEAVPPPQPKPTPKARAPSAEEAALLLKSAKAGR